MFTQRFLKLFPPPDYLGMPCVGLDVSDEAIRFVELTSTRKGIRLSRYGERILPKGTIEAGYIQDEETLKRELLALRKEFGLYFIRAAMPEEKAYLFKIEIPRVEDKEIRGAIELRLEENVPLSPSAAIFDYEVIGRDVEKNTIQVSVSVVPQKVVDAYLDAFTSAGLAPLDFEVEGRAISRAFIREADNGTYMVINFAERRTGIFIVSSGIVCFSSSLSIGGEALTSTLAKSLSISFEEADKLKHERGTANRESVNIFEYSINTLSALKDEVNKVYDYWHEHNDGNKKISAILLSGENSILVGLDEYLALSLGVSVVAGNPWVNAFDFDSYIPPIDAARALAYAVPVGLALANIHHV